MFKIASIGLFIAVVRCENQNGKPNTNSNLENAKCEKKNISAALLEKTNKRTKETKQKNTLEKINNWTWKTKQEEKKATFNKNKSCVTGEKRI